MYQAEVEVFDPRSRTHYPNKDIDLYGRIGYFVYDRIPFYYEIHSDAPEPAGTFSPFLDTQDLFLSSIILSNKAVPTTVFSQFSHLSICLRSEGVMSSDFLVSKIKRIVSGAERIPILYDVYANAEIAEPLATIQAIRNESEYIDLFHGRQAPLEEVTAWLSNSFEFSSQPVDHGAIDSFYELLLSAPREIHIALHYLIKAARLVCNYFPEDAAINLNLASAAIISDYQEVSRISNKSLAVERLLSRELGFDEDTRDWLGELYAARNEFLAHPDLEMFTSSQNIGDPDRYCYDHFEPICDLIIKYASYRNGISKNTNGQ